MQKKLVVPTLAATAACALGAVPVASAASDVQQAASANWAGYVVGSSSSGSSGTEYKSVTGTWVQPTANCSNGQGYSAFWDGLGGAGQTEALEQAGTEADCSASGSASYFAWYELVPSAPVQVSMAVHPGDSITSKVTVEGSNVTIDLSNNTTGQTFTKTLQMSNPDTSSAEWIAEAPSSCTQGVSNCTPLALTDFGTVKFSGASATTTGGHTGTISDSDWSTAAVSLSPSASDSGFGGTQFASQETSAGATPSSLSSDGSGFSVTWSADAGSGGASDTSGSAGGYPGSSSDGGYPGSSSAGGYPSGGYGYGGGGDGYGSGDGYGYGSGDGYGYGDGGYGGYGYSGAGYGYYGSAYAGF